MKTIVVSVALMLALFTPLSNMLPKYDNSLFKQVIKYYTLKSQSKTIQIEELYTYLRLIRNILGFTNYTKNKEQKNSYSNINIYNASNIN